MSSDDLLVIIDVAMIGDLLAEISDLTMISELTVSLIFVLQLYLNLSGKRF